MTELTREGFYRALQPAARATSRWLIRRSDVRQAVEQSGDSAAGPDGIPYLAWRRLGNLGVDVLFAVAQQLEQDRHGCDLRSLSAG